MSEPEQLPQVELPGYELIEKIGAGGYGEVWSAVAPGGMRKAVKFVFGNEYDKRATSELHSLEKIKAVRHPFLLSLERIEIVEGRLVVVSELADGSLRDRFVECIEQGLPGIPRAELLGYLSDASDALDYIGDRHDLAHLDIKPENLLLVAGHVKVADFGLVKSLNNQTQASLVGGMTPTYAAPEVFRGTPSRQSDQYSLAILYQEMLTGSVPFPGVNAAELTLQHMKDDPDLVRLPESDRFAAARALSKEPKNRFDSCGALVKAIRDSSSSQIEGSPFENSGHVGPGRDSAAVLQPISKQEKLNRHGVTEVFAEPSAAGCVDAIGDSMRLPIDPLPTPEPQPIDPPELEAGATSFNATPVVFVGIGGTGARVLRSLRSQINEHLGASGPLAAAPMLLLDTDPQTLATATSGSRGLDASETVSLPLRRPQDYRDKADLLLRWLGRRWLYNIPRSLRTEGIRPLGRLALVDHARQAFQRLRGVLMSAIDESSRQASEEAVGLPFDQPGVRVYVVGSAAGAAGSGMSIDIGYAVRSILSRLGIESPKVFGVITHSTFREATRGELARVNSYAWLSEFERHRQSDEGYPGDPSVGLPSHEAGVPAFDHTYFVPMGNQVDTPEYELAADSIAEYLFADAFTPSQRVLDACRASATGGSTLRSFAVRHRDGLTEHALDADEQAAVGRMIDRWLGDEDLGPNESAGQQSTDQVVHGAVAFLGKTQLDSSTLASNCRSMIEASLGGDASAYIEARFRSQAAHDPTHIAAGVDACFGIATADGVPCEIDGKAVDSIVSPIALKLAGEARDWVMSRVNETQERLDGAERALEWLQDYLKAVDTDLLKVTGSVVAEHSRWLDGLPTKSNDAEARASQSKLFRLRLDQSALIAARRLVTTLHRSLIELPHELAVLREAVLSLRDEIAPQAETAAASPGDLHNRSLAIEQRLQSEYLIAPGGLLGGLSGAESLNQLPATIAHAARVVTREQTGGNRAASDAALAAGFAEAPLAGAGGSFYRLTLRQPSVSEEESDDSEQDELLLVTEMQGASLPHVAVSLIGARRDYAAFAERVRTRRDIVWVDPVTGGARETLAAPTRPSESTLFPESDSPQLATAVLQ